MAARPQRSTKSATQLGSIQTPGITLGVEFEFLLLESFEKGQRPQRNPQESTKHGLSLLLGALKKPVWFTCSSCGEAHEYDLTPKVQTEERSGSDPNYWNVLYDNSMKLKIPQTATLRDRDCDFYAVEVTSRALSKDNAKQTTQSITDASRTHTITYQEGIGCIECFAKGVQYSAPSGWTVPWLSSSNQRYLRLPCPCQQRLHRILVANGQEPIEHLCSFRACNRRDAHNVKDRRLNPGPHSS
jgi:hypothetical protein